MNTNEVTIVVPVYKLGPLRFNNFCFLIRKLNEVGCSVIVVEQESDKTGAVEQICLGYNNVSHTVVSVEGNEINKSILINTAFKRVYTDFMWMVDGDFYTNFCEVLALADSSSDLIVPFSEVLFLEKSETINLQTSDTISLDPDEKYKTNSQEGKFSFIIRSSTYSSANGMNENFFGWGFQDLDFVENRLTGDELKSRVQIQGFHMFHLPQTKTNIDVNKKLYLNYKEVSIKNVVKQKLKEYVGHANSLDQRKTDFYTKKLKLKPENKTSESSNKIVKKVITKWKKPEYGILYSSNSKIYYPTNDVITIRDSSLVEYKNINGHFSKLNANRHYLYYYFEYICHVYGMFSSGDVILFANDGFCKTNEQIDSFSDKLRQIKQGNVINTHNEEFMYLYKEQNIKDGNLIKKYSPQGCFLIKSDLILKKKFDYYYNIYTQLEKASMDDFVKKSQNLSGFFLDY